jgi:hypothetical protein
MKSFVIDFVVQGSSDFNTEHYVHRESGIHCESLYFGGEKARRREGKKAGPWVVASFIWTATDERDMVEADSNLSKSRPSFANVVLSPPRKNMCRV